MSCAMMFARRVMDLLFSSERLGVGRTMILAACLCDACEFGPAGDRKHIKETRGTVQMDGLNDALIEYQQEVGCTV